jgi:hypothetical protein
MRSLDAQQLTAADVARLLDLGCRLERDALEAQTSMLSTSDDPFDRIAAELLS